MGTMLGAVFKACGQEPAMDVMVSQRCVDDCDESVPAGDRRSQMDAGITAPLTEKQTELPAAVKQAISKPGRPTLITHDYQWRPPILKDFPLYFFQAATDVSTQKIRDGTYQWYEKPAAHGASTVSRHPCYAQSEDTPSLWVRSRLIKDRRGQFVRLPRSNEEGHYCYYNHYRILRTEKPWKVPILYGAIPRLTGASTTAQDRGRYAIFMMLLFRPWRDKDEAVQSWAGACFRRGNIEDIWNGIFLSFLAWRRELIDTAWPYYDRSRHDLEFPSFQTNSLVWWACVVYPRLLSMELFLSRRSRSSASDSVQLLGLPVEEIERPKGDAEVEACSGNEDEDEGDGADHGDREGVTPDTQQPVPGQAPSVYPPVVGVRCGVLPPELRLHDAMASPCNLGRRSAESHYAAEYLARTQEAALDAASIDRHQGCVVSDVSDSFPRSHWSPAAMKAKCEQQKFYFDHLDTDAFADDSSCGFTRDAVITQGSTRALDISSANDPFAEVKRDISAAFLALAAETSRKQPSHTVVLEAAAYLLHRGLLSVKKEIF